MVKVKKDISGNGEEIARSVLRYRKIMSHLELDLPIQVMCLPKVIENILLDMGCLRIYDMVDLDLTKIKGLGLNRRSILSAALDKFFSM